MSWFRNDFVVFETFSETVPYPGLTSTVALKLYSWSKYLGEPLRSKYNFKNRYGVWVSVLAPDLILKPKFGLWELTPQIFSLLLNEYDDPGNSQSNLFRPPPYFSNWNGLRFLLCSLWSMRIPKGQTLRLSSIYFHTQRIFIKGC